MKILVTGAAGYLGSVLCPMLLGKGHEVIALDNFMYGQISLADCCRWPNFKLIKEDCRNILAVRALLSDCDFFIPLAAIVGAPACSENPTAAREINFEAISGAVKHTTPKIIFPNTNSGYRSGYSEECTEDSPLDPASHYGMTKVDAEEIVLERNGISFRFATLFGISPRMRFDLIVNDFVRRAVTQRSVVLFEGHFRRNFLHVRDAAYAFVWAVTYFDEMKGRAYNVGLLDANLTKRQLCEKIKEHVPDFYFTEAAIGEDPDKRDYIVSNTRVRATGWKSQYSLDDGIRELIKGLQMYRNPWGNA